MVDYYYFFTPLAGTTALFNPFLTSIPARPIASWDIIARRKRSEDAGYIEAMSKLSMRSSDDMDPFRHHGEELPFDVEKAVIDDVGGIFTSNLPTMSKHILRAMVHLGRLVAESVFNLTVSVFTGIKLVAAGLDWYLIGALLLAIFISPFHSVDGEIETSTTAPPYFDRLQNLGHGYGICLSREHMPHTGRF